MPQSPDRSVASRPSAWLIAGCLFSVYVIWGTTYFAIKVGVQGEPPFFLIGTRFFLAGGLLTVWQLLHRRKAPTLKQWRNAALLGFLLLVVGNGGVAVAERWVSSGATVALISVMPIATALWSGVFGHWPRRLEWVAIAIGALGAVVMLMGRDLQGSLLGTLIILCGTTCWSLGTVLSRRLDVPHGPLGFGAEMLTAGVMALVLSAVLGTAARARGLVGLGLPRRVRFADRVLGVPFRRRAGVPDPRRDLRVCQSAGRAGRRLVAGQ
jgi:drug/metabolite transporter (DMT)-like permease